MVLLWVAQWEAPIPPPEGAEPEPWWEVRQRRFLTEAAARSFAATLPRDGGAGVVQQDVQLREVVKFAGA